MKKVRKGKREALNYDLRISVHKNGRVAFYFRQGSFEAITKTGYINVFLEGENIYFSDSDSDGYPVTQHTENDILNHYGSVFIRQEYVREWAKKHIGTYNLKKEENDWFTIVKS